MTQTSIARRTFHYVESRSASGVDGWRKRSRGLTHLDDAMDALRDWADEAPHLNWRVVSGSPQVIHASRGAVQS